MLKNASIILGTKYLFGLGLVGAISFSGVVLTSVGAGASSPSYMTTSWTPQVSPNYQGAQYWTVTRGTHVSWNAGPRGHRNWVLRSGSTLLPTHTRLLLASCRLMP